MQERKVTTAVILCGGKGSRLGEVTGGDIPKPMVNVGNQPILFHIMNYYSKFGINDFILCAGHKSWKIK
jgi:glucose-1-phosphate cytidylyltransferase